MENKTNDLKMSVITPCFNSASTIGDTLDSVEAQHCVNMEHIIIDGASGDGTLDIIREYSDRVPYEVKIVSEPDGGIYDAMNKGIKLSTGDLTGIINSDDRFAPNAFELIQNAYTGAEHEIIYGMIRSFDGDRLKTMEFYHHDFLLDRMINHPGSFITPACYRDFGLYDTSFKSSADYAWMKGAMDKGAVFTPIYEVLADIRLGGMSGSNTGFRETLNLQYEWGRVSRARYLAYTFKSRIGDLYRSLHH
ncbi:MAG: glycosyltransferase [Lachnospiraceae bacterium]|nr:glycosyltransferase [Lachnospiraceae bacterium]